MSELSVPFLEVDDLTLNDISCALPLNSKSSEEDEEALGSRDVFYLMGIVK